MNQPLELLVIGLAGKRQQLGAAAQPCAPQVVGLLVIATVRLGVVGLGLAGRRDGLNAKNAAPRFATESGELYARRRARAKIVWSVRLMPVAARRKNGTVPVGEAKNETIEMNHLPGVY
jgi:hypothetical protein